MLNMLKMDYMGKQKEKSEALKNIQRAILEQKTIFETKNIINKHKRRQIKDQ